MSDEDLPTSKRNRKFLVAPEATKRALAKDDLEELKQRMAALSGKSGKKRKPSQSTPDTSLAKLNRRAARKRSKEKGSSFERKVAKLFTAWCGWTVRRTPQSGGWSSAAFGVSGDLVCEDKRFPFHIECKNREDWQLDDLVTGVRVKDERSIRAWWQQTVDTCPAGKEPLLIFKRNNKHTLVMLRTRYLTDGARPYEVRLAMSRVPQFSTTLRDTPQGDTVVSILSLERFLATEPVPQKKYKEKRP